MLQRDNYKNAQESKSMYSLVQVRGGGKSGECEGEYSQNAQKRKPAQE